MTFHDEVLGSVYMVQTLIGVLGNFFLIYNYCVHFFTQKRPRQIIIIFFQLSFANAIFLLYRGIPTAIFCLKIKIFLSHAECRILSYLQRVSRGISLCSTCLLSIFQAIAISPKRPKWLFLTVKSPKGIINCCVSCWMLNVLIDIPLLAYTPCAKQNSTMVKDIDKLGFCFLNPYSMNSLNFQLWKSLYDSLLVLLMIIFSGYMLFVLYKHHQRVQHIHSTSPSLRCSPEVKATKAILLLVSTYFLFNSACSAITIYAYFYVVTGPWLFYIPIFLSMSYQVVSPFVLIISDTLVPWKFFCFFQVMKDSCSKPIFSQTHTETHDKNFGE